MSPSVFVAHFRQYGERGFARANLRRNQRAPLLHMQRIRLHQPYVPVNSRAFVKPSVALGGIHSHQENVSLAGIGEVGNVEAERIVTTAVPPDVEAVQHDHGLAVCAVELEGDAFAGIFGRKVENAAVPTHAGGRVFTAQRVITLAQQVWVVLKRQLDGPIMGQIEAPPVAIVEGQAACGKKFPVF